FSNKPGMVSTVIFHTPTGLRLEIDTPKTVFFIAFLSKHDQIVVCSTYDDNVRVQLWCCWSGKLIKEDDHPYIDKDQPLAFADDQFVHATGNKIVKYPLFPDKTEKNYRITIKQLSCVQQCSPVSQRFDLNSLIDSSLGHPVCSILIHKKEKVYCRFKFEPWRKWISPNLFMQWLDEDGNRFLLAGNDSIQIYKTKPKGQILKVELQYIWTVPYYKEADIKYMSLEILKPLQDDGNDDHEPSYRLKVQLTNSETIIISLPEANDKFTYQILIDACMSANLMRLLFGEDPSYVSRFDIHAQLKKLIQNSIDKFPSAFNKISLGDGQYIYPMEDFILFEWDDIVTAILNNEKYIPLFHNDEQTESALALLIELQKSDLLDQLISYIIRHVRDSYTPPNSNSKPSSVISVQDISRARIQQPGFAWTVGAALLDLYRYYPDKGSKILREWSHLTTSLETPTRILRTKLGNPLKIEERSFHPELKTVSRDAHLPKENSVHQSIWKLIVAKMFCNIFHKRNATIISTTTTTTATFAPSDRFNAGSSVFTINVIGDDKKDFQQIHVHRKRQRQQRLNNVQKSHPAKLCVVPLPDFCVYPAPPEINKNSSIQEYIKRLWATYVSPKRLSPYAEAAIHGPLEMFKIRQMLGRWKNYWMSFANYLDLASFGLPLITCSFAISGHEPSDILKSYATLLVWINALFLSRAFAGTGKFISIVLEILKEIKMLVLTLAFMVVGFANALFVLLRNNEGVTVSNFTGTLTNTTSNEIIGKLDLGQSPNVWWTYFPWSIFSTYKFLGIGWDGLSVYDPEWAGLCMMVLFSLIIEVFNASLRKGRQAWLRQRAQVIAEIELYFLTPSQRYHAEWFPHLIYYESHLDSVQGWRQQLYRDALGEVNVEFIKNELKEVKSDMIGELKEVKGIVGQIRILVNLESGET
ncbi:1755_t:CDS:2, partial [Racocetra persica]